MTFNYRACLIIAGMALLMVASGCASSKVGKNDEKNPYAYLDDAAMEKFDNDLSDLSLAIDRADLGKEASLRRQIGEMARQYQAALVSALNDRSSMQRRRLASVVLGFTGDVAVIPPLLAKIEEDEPESVRSNAVLGLATLGAKLREFQRHEQLMVTLKKLMQNKDSSASMRVNAVQAYAAAYDRVLNDSITPLKDRFMSDPDLGVSIAAVNAMGDIGDTAASADLIGVGLTHPSDHIRIASAIALGKIPDAKNNVPPLVKASLDDESPDVRREAINSLAYHFAADQETVYSALLLGLTDFSDSVRESAALALSRTQDQRAIDPLIQATGDRTAIVRRAAAESLGSLIDKEKEASAFALVDLLADQTPEVRKAAEIALHDITGKNFGEDQGAWRTYFYKTYPALDPANAYVGKPKPRMTSSIQGGGRTSSSRPSTSRPSSTRPSSTRPSSNRPSGTRNQPSSQPAPRR